MRPHIPRRSLKGVLFDKDGTLIDFQQTWGPTVHAMILALAGNDPIRAAAQAEALHFLMDEKRFLPTSPIIAGSTEHYAPIWGAALGRSDLAALALEIDALAAIESLKALTPIGDPAAVFARLRAAGLRIGIATNDSEASARRQAAALGDVGVEFIVGYDSGHGGKPEPGMVTAFARFLGAAPAEIAMVGDSLHDLDAGRAAGALTIAVLTGPADRATLEPCADAVIDDIEALPDLLAAIMATAPA